MAVGPRLLSAINNSFSADNSDITAAQSDYIVIMAALFCGLICAICLAMAARFCFHRRLNVPAIASSLPPPPSGLNKKILQVLPTKKYVPGAEATGEQADCAICLLDFADGDVMRILPHCGHVFHVTCIDKFVLVGN